MKRWSVSAVLLAALVSPTPGGAETKDIGVVSVTVPGMEQKIEDVQATVEVIDEKVMESTSGRSIGQYLQLGTGLSVKDSGTNTEVFIRGFDADQTLILVDGLRRTGKFGSMSLTGIETADVERIEVVRGSMSALYGSDAMGGVVNIVTKKGGAEPSVTASVLLGTAEAEQRETAIVRAGVETGRIGATRHRISVETMYRDSFRWDSNQPETDLSENERLYSSYHGTLDLGAGHWFRLGGEFYHQDDSGVGLDRLGAPADSSEQEDRYHATGNYHLERPNWILDWNAGFGRSMATSVRGGSVPEDTDYKQRETNAYLTLLPFRAHTLTLGAGARKEDIDLSTFTDDQDRTVYDVLAQDQWEVTDTVTLVAGVRYDDYSDFGDTVNPRATLAWSPGQWHLRAGAGTAFKAPRFTQLYGTFRRGIYDIQGNEDLDEETSWSLEAAAGFRSERFSAEAVYHYSELDDLIISEEVSRTIGPGGRPTNIVVSWANVNKATIQGAELSVNAVPVSFWDFGGSFDYLDATDDEDGGRLLNRPRWQLKLLNAFHYERSTLYANARFVWDYFGTDFESADRKDKTSDHYVIDVKFTQGLFEGHELSLGVDNVADQETPSTMGIFGSADDPGARFYYVGYALRI